MTSFIKGIIHTVASAVVLWLPLANPNFIHLTIGAVIAIVANWAISNTIPTTTGASATQ